MRRRSVVLAVFAILAISGGIFSLWLRPSPEMVEYFDGNFTTSLGIATMEQAHLKALPHKGVAVYVLNSNSELLLLRRSPRMETCPGRYCVVGEHTDPQDASWEATVRRGLREEVLRPADLSEMPVHQLGTEVLRHRYPDGRFDIQLTLWSYVTYPAPLKSVLMDSHEVAQKEPQFHDLAAVWRLLRAHPDHFCDPEGILFARGLPKLCKALTVERVPSCASVLSH
eukprot:EG_transcript_25746